MDLGREQHLRKFLDGFFSASPSSSFDRRLMAAAAHQLALSPLPIFMGAAPILYSRHQWGKDEWERRGREGGGV